MYEFLTGLTLFSEMNKPSENGLERTRSEENGALDDFINGDEVFNEIYALLIKSQDIDDAELRRDAVSMIWATLMVHLNNKYIH